MMGATFVQLDLAPLLIGTLAAIACALPGNFLVLRRQASDRRRDLSRGPAGQSSSPFLVTGHDLAWPMMLGAAGAALGRGRH